MASDEAKSAMEKALSALSAAGVEILTEQRLTRFEPGQARFESVYGGAGVELEADAVLPVGARQPDDALWLELEARRDEFDARGGLSMQRIGDCRAPGIIAAAVHAGHLATCEAARPT